MHPSGYRKGNSGWDYASPIAGGGPVTRWKGSFFVGWGAHDRAGAATLRYISGYESGTTLFYPGTTTQLKIASYNAVDLNAEYRGLENWRFLLGVVNLLNRQPPYDSGALIFLSSPGGPYDPTTYDDLGRMINLRVTNEF
jgi:outer membrane receptor protein involved in Fe transport